MHGFSARADSFVRGILFAFCTFSLFLQCLSLSPPTVNCSLEATAVPDSMNLPLPEVSTLQFTEDPTTLENEMSNCADVGKGSPFVLNDGTLDEIIQMGCEMHARAERLERLIHGVRGESYRQLEKASQAYVDAFKRNDNLDEYVKEVQKASQRCMDLDKLWKQAAFGVRNRTAAFADLPQTSELYPALAYVFEHRSPESEQ